MRTLRDASFTAYFAGGCVRDELLGRTPDDYDVATDATPEKIAALFSRTSQVGAHFGVQLVKFEHAAIEVATFRSDGAYSDNRRPDSVTFTTPREDALRRDFTVNALFLDPFGVPNAPNAGGAVIDFVNGLDDLAAKTIRAVGNPDARLAEDHLRALRAVRFAARLGFTIEPNTALAIRRHASQLLGVSRERIGEEVRRMAAHPSRAAAAACMDMLALTRPALLLDSPASPTCKHLLALSPDAPLELALAAWALDLGADVSVQGSALLTSTWRSALCLSNDEMAALRWIFTHIAAMESDYLTRSIAQQKRLAAKPCFLHALDLVAARHPDRAAHVQFRADELAATPGGVSPHPFITGDDLVARGLKPGPKFKPLLDSVYDAQLEGRITDAAQAMDLATQLIEDPTAF